MRDANRRKSSPTPPLVGTTDKSYVLYNLVDRHGGGELIPWMRYALNSGDYSLLDGYLETTIKDMMMNGGKGRLESVAELVKRRNKERNERLSAFNRKKGKGKSQPNILDNFNQENNQGDLKKGKSQHKIISLKLLDGGKGGKGDAKYREVVWKYECRGAMGENLVGCCLTQGTTVHNKLVQRLIEQYPHLVNDIFISEDYYGLSPLHMAIVNEDATMVAYLLGKGADITQRCYGAFFCPEDQVSSRSDSLEHEYVDLNLRTDYSGKMYFGEYPLAFAACTNQVECYRILRSKRADPNAQDTNGNTVLHMCVIHENAEMFRLAYETGARLQITNKQSLTPLTLAAKLAKKTMFEQILRLESSPVWNYGSADSTQYPLAKIDTINQETGELNDASVLYLETTEHLDLLDGLLEDVLQAKWEAFGRRRWIMSLSAFIFYYVFYFMAFMCRPFSMTTSVITGEEIDIYGHFTHHSLDLYLNGYNQSIVSRDFNNITSSAYFHKNTCHLWHYFGTSQLQNYVRLVSELMVYMMAIFQVCVEGYEIYSIGRRRWWQVLRSFPAKIFYKISLLLTLSIFPIRLSCGLNEFMLLLDNMLSVIGVITTTVHFLYYARAVRFVGPFVLMIYTIITRDMIRFFLIYFIFLMGFSQAFYIIFLACERAEAISADEDTAQNNNIMSNPIDSLLRLFIMTIGEFTTLYRDLSDCQVTSMSVIGKILFLIFEMFVSLMQFNLLIAMMTRTYEVIFQTQKEAKRQWAQVILMLEISLQPKDRLVALLKYSRPHGADKQTRLETLTEMDKQLKQEQENEKRREKRVLLKKRLRDLKNNESKTPYPTRATPYLHA
ncbi:Transient receptor potential cation channel subfamily V member 6 [Aphelenchoides besseyi]|nr:Transient receptor potential cation channel subfamily V member 6 [Aphelenchoides besseyi]KAI6227103.1 Transient receptor potential cation channel subfamily V member 6 [Aphelenchoides besseyi]